MPVQTLTPLFRLPTWCQLVGLRCGHWARCTGLTGQPADVTLMALGYYQPDLDFNPEVKEFTSLPLPFPLGHEHREFLQRSLGHHGNVSPPP